MILDPEEGEYVLPNDGFTGFLIVLNCSAGEQGEFFIGSGFHNMVRISSAVGGAQSVRHCPCIEVRSNSNFFVCF